MTSLRKLAAGLLGVGAIFAWGAHAAEYDLTNCSASTVTTISSSPALTLLAVEAKGISRANGDSKVFDNSSYQCASLVRVAAGKAEAAGLCRYVEPDGDAVVGEFTLSGKEGSWRFLEGTGKWSGIVGGGTFRQITSARPVAAGTSQGCVHAVGRYELKK